VFKISPETEHGLQIMDMSCDHKSCYGNRLGQRQYTCVCQVNAYLIHVCIDTDKIVLAEFLGNYLRGNKHVPDK
jgi:hypothetical protein